MKKLIAMLMLLMFVGVPVSANNKVDEGVTYKIVKFEDKETEGFEEPYMTTTVLLMSFGKYAEVEVDPVNEIIIIQPKGGFKIESEEQVIELLGLVGEMAKDDIFEDYKFAIMNSKYNLGKNDYEFTDDDLVAILHKGELIKGLDD